MISQAELEDAIARYKARVMGDASAASNEVAVATDTATVEPAYTDPDATPPVVADGEGFPVQVDIDSELPIAGDETLESNAASAASSADQTDEGYAKAEFAHAAAENEAVDPYAHDDSTVGRGVEAAPAGADDEER